MLLQAQAHFLTILFTSQPGGNTISHSDMNQIISCFNSQTFINKEEFSKKNTLSQTIGIIYQGVFKAVSKDANGEEKIRNMYFAPYNNVVVDCASFGANRLSLVSIFSKKESVLLTISEYDFNYLCIHIPDFGIVGRNMLLHSCKALEKWQLDTNLLAPPDKVIHFNTCFPHAKQLLSCAERASIIGVGKNDV